MPRKISFIALTVLFVLCCFYSFLLCQTAAADITIDGNFCDWSGIPAIGTDTLGDVPEGSAVDWTSLKVAQSETFFFLNYTCKSMAGSAIFAIYIYLDTDGDPMTGYSVNGIGADYLIRGAAPACLFRYPGQGCSSSWPAWVNMGPLTALAAMNSCELAIPKEEIGSPPSFYLILQADNEIVDDMFPDSGHLAFNEGSRTRLPGFDSSSNYVFYHGEWSDALALELRQKYDLVIVHPTNPAVVNNVTTSQIAELKKGPDGIAGTADDVIVLGYIIVGEDLRTVNEATEEKIPSQIGDGTGPKIGPWPGNPSTGGTGYASYYVDDRPTIDTNGDDIPDAPDGKPDRRQEASYFNPDIEVVTACVVNAGDPNWQYVVKNGTRVVDGFVGGDEMINFYGCDGLFLDEVDAPAPAEWGAHWEWTACGMRSMLRFLSETYPNKIIAINRGLVFLSPDYHYQYNIRPYVNLIMYETYYCTPNALDNRRYWAPKLNAEANRPDGFTVVALDWTPILVDGIFSDWFVDYWHQDTTMQEWVSQLDSGAGLEENSDDTPTWNIDWVNIWAAHDQERLYIRCKTKAETIFSDGQSGYFYDIFIDTDQNTATGFRGESNDWSIGADYLIENGKLFKNSGSGWNWGWPDGTGTWISGNCKTVKYKIGPPEDLPDYPNSRLREIEMQLERSDFEGQDFAEYRFLFNAFGGGNSDQAPNNFISNYYSFIPDTFKIIERIKVDQGWLSYCTNGGHYIDDYVYSNPVFDTAAPVWDSTTAQLVWGATQEPAPRVGAGEVEAGDGQVIVRWDVARDQTQPVKYNIYYSATSPINFDTANRITNVSPSVGRDYRKVTWAGAHVFPYEYAVTGLTNGQTYYFAVRAEDSTSGVTTPVSGRIGPNGGIEEVNTVELSAFPYHNANLTISTGDSTFSDWNGIPCLDLPPYELEHADETVPDAIDIEDIWAANDTNNLYVRLKCVGNVDTAGNDYYVFLDTDENKQTGYIGYEGNWSIGADYAVHDGTLFKYDTTQSDHKIWDWIQLQAIPYSARDTGIEMAISRALIEEKDTVEITKLLIMTTGGYDADFAPTYYIENSYTYYYALPPRVIDGNFSDWSSVPVLGTDPFGDALGDVVDWTSLWATNDAGMLYLSYETASNISFSSGIGGLHKIFIDADNNASTGFKGTDGSFGIGAEYLLTGPGNLLRYTGSGTDDNWSFVGSWPCAWFAKKFEMAVPEASLGLGANYNIKIMLLGNNPTTKDYAKDDKSGYTYFKDTIAPTGTISINGGTASTTSTSVTLTLSATDAGSGMGSGAQMKFSNDGTTYSSPQAYATTKSWTLTTGNGTKTVYVKFKDVEGNWSSAYTDTILLVSPITINGNFSDWAGIAALGTDPSGDASGGIVDWTSLWATAQNNTLYLSYQTVSNINFASNAWRYAIYIDKDNNSSTGFKWFDGSFLIGAEYLIEGSTLFRYTGNGTSWSWSSASSLSYSFTANRLEMAIPESNLGLAANYTVKIMLLGNNPTTIDYAQNNKSGYTYTK